MRGAAAGSSGFPVSVLTPKVCDRLSHMQQQQAALSHRKIRLNGGYAGELASYYVSFGPGAQLETLQDSSGFDGGRPAAGRTCAYSASAAALESGGLGRGRGRQAAASIALSLAPSVRSFRRPREGGSYTAMLQLKSRRRTDGLAGCQDTHRQADRHGRGRPLARSLAASKGRPDRPTGGGRPGARKKGSVPSYTLNTRL